MLTDALKSFIKERAFPCIGAHTALALDQLQVVELGDLQSSADDRRILKEVYAFVAQYRKEPSLYRSLVLAFKEPTQLDELQFERALWQRLQALHDLGRHVHPWAAGISTNPADKNFSFSLAGEAFYLIGMHPNSSRPARRFSAPAIVLNLHAQFDELRAKGKYIPMRNIIRKRDEAYSGSVNPMMKDFGEASEAVQYSGRNVTEAWKCPFHAKS